MQSGNHTYLLFIIKQLFNIIYLGKRAEVMTNEIIFNKIHSEIQADLLKNESNVEDNDDRESGIIPN